MANPIISVIVPVYKAEKYLSKCIDSILNQSFTDFELLLINDGSPDRSGEICEAYAEKDMRIRVFHQQNGGVGRARNNGLAHAQGQYVVFADSDDWVLPDYLGDLYKEVCTHSGVGLIIHGAHMVSSRNKPLKDFLFPDVYLPYQHFGEAFTKYELLFWGFPWSKIYNKTVLDDHDIRFDEDIHCREDTLFMLRYLFFCDYIQFRSIVNYIYIYLNDSLSHGHLNSFESEYETFKIFRNMCRKIMHTWNISENVNIQVTLADIFQRALKTDYQPYHQVCRKKRIEHLKMLTDTAGDVLRIGSRFFAFKIDWVGGLFLEWRWFVCYDWYIRLMFRFPVRRFAYDSIRVSSTDFHAGMCC